MEGLPRGLGASLAAEWRGLNGQARASVPLGSLALASAELDRAADQLLSLQRGLTGPRSLLNTRYMDRPSLLGAYLLYYWPSSYGQVRRAWEEASGLEALRGLSRPQPRRVLDLGCGPGASAAAMAGLGANSLCLVDPSAPALEVAARILRRAYPGLALDIREGLAEGALGDAGLSASNGLGRDFPSAMAVGGPWDAIIMSHSLNEVANSRADRLEIRRALLASLAASLAPGGVLLIVEPAITEASRELMALRDAILTEAGPTLRLIGPCLHSEACPALSQEGQSCHDAFAWIGDEVVQELARRANLGRPELKFSWLAFRKGLSLEVEGEDAKGRAEGLAWPYRVVSDMMLNKAGKSRYMLCGRGRRCTLSARVGDLGPTREAFAGLSRGDILDFSGAAEKDSGGFELLAHSSLMLCQDSRYPRGSRPAQGEARKGRRS